MDGIGKECQEVNSRMAQLSQRLDKVSVEVKQFDINAKDPDMMVDPPEVQSLSKVTQCSQLLTPESRPAVVQERYVKAEPPPMVHILQHVRDADPDDQKVCLQMYSDPSYFYQQWLNDMVAMTEIEQKKKEDEKKEKGKKKRKKNQGGRVVLINLEDIVTHDELIRQKHGYATRDIKRASKNLRNTGIWKSLDIELPSPPDDPLKNTTNNQVQPQQSIKPPPQADPTPQTRHTTQHASSPPPPQHPPPAPEVHNSAVAP